MVLEQITRDLDWRESELGSLKILLKNPTISLKQREVLLRAAWAMLYAHYEGYSKFCLTVFFDEAQKRVVQCKNLPTKTRALALAKTLRKIKSFDSVEMLHALEAFPQNCLDGRPDFSEVNTNSNLWPNLLVNLLTSADLNPAVVQGHKTKIDTLVSRRNGIAYGERDIIKEIDYYLTYEEAVYDVMYALAFEIDRRLNVPPYKIG